MRQLLAKWVARVNKDYQLLRLSLKHELPNVGVKARASGFLLYSSQCPMDDLSLDIAMN
jgi:hypothetical protein